MKIRLGGKEYCCAPSVELDAPPKFNDHWPEFLNVNPLAASATVSVVREAFAKNVGMGVDELLRRYGADCIDTRQIDNDCTAIIVDPNLAAALSGNIVIEQSKIVELMKPGEVCIVKGPSE